MLKKKNSTGILAIASVITLILLMLIIRSQAEMVKALYVKLAMTNFALVVASAGIYLTDVFTVNISRRVKLLTWYMGGLLVLLAFLVCFNILPFSSTWNWLIVFGILFILVVQLQLLHWGNRVPQMVRFSALLIVFCDAFLIFFFIAKWQNYQLGAWINFATVISIVLTIIGLIFLKKQTSSN